MGDDETRLLVVSSDATTGKLCADVATREGCRAVVASSGTEALALLELEPFSVVLLDLAVRDADAMSVLATLRRQGVLPALPVMAVGVPNADDGGRRAEALRAGAIDFVSVPLDGLELGCRLRAFVELRRLRALNAERIRTEARLRESQQRLELALRGAELAAWDWDVRSGHVIFNARWAEMRGFDPEEIKPHVDSWISGVHPDDLPGAHQALNDHLESRTPEYEAELRVRARSGEWLWVLCRGRVFERDAEGRPTA